MKTTISLLTIIFALNVILLAAGNPKSFAKSNGIGKTENTINLAPVTPKEADFQDSDPEVNQAVPDLRPVVPHEASFEEVIETSLKPATPKEADFED